MVQPVPDLCIQFRATWIRIKWRSLHTGERKSVIFLKE